MGCPTLLDWTVADVSCFELQLAFFALPVAMASGIRGARVFVSNPSAHFAMLVAAGTFHPAQTYPRRCAAILGQQFYVAPHARFKVAVLGAPCSSAP